MVLDQVMFQPVPSCSNLGWNRITKRKRGFNPLFQPFQPNPYIS